jgi:hypothetical protein
MRAALQVLGALMMLAGAGVLLLLMRYAFALAGPKFTVPASVWASHIVPGALLVLAGLFLLGRSRRLP